MTAVSPGPADAVPSKGISYASAGVDIDAGERAVTLIRAAVDKTRRPEVVGGLGGFAGLFELDLTRYRRPVLASSTDGVGTKLAIAQAMDRHDTIGIDLVAMVVDDLVVCGAEPLFVSDYIACGQVVPERIADIVAGIAAGCLQSGAALVGGETAEHADLMRPDDYDVAATAVGIVEADTLLGPERVRLDDVVLAMGSTGLHSNGYVLARRVLLQHAGLQLADPLPDADRGAPALGELLLTPTRIYALDCLALTSTTDVHAFAHITGGGLAGNLGRVIPATLQAVLDRRTWELPELVSTIGRLGQVALPELERTFNCGVGMVAIVPEGSVAGALAVLTGRGVPAWVAGRITERPGAAAGSAARLTGDYADFPKRAPIG
ncbi:MAG: phosphoribosylformylglycinamidine cyclo-ligase [Geodermatophilaceae bacterium]|nr:phosphoribosylformylglycinamidine cyclo-ligase [Geodermatophilaceae bacterium]